MSNILKNHTWFPPAVRHSFGAISLMMGGAAVAPTAYCRVFGVQSHGHVMRVIGIRDLVIAIGLLTQTDRRWLVFQACADLLDAALVAGWLRRRSIAPKRGIGWLGGALIAAVLALVAARRS